MNILSRQHSLREGLLYYFTGKTCRYGHRAKRWTKNGVCTECAARYHKSYSPPHPRVHTPRIWTEEQRVRRNAKSLIRHHKIKKTYDFKTKKKQYYQSHKAEYIARMNKRRAAKLKATPAWANDGYIRLFYQYAELETTRTQQKVVVDHIIPLQHPLVCGLHVEHNLQLLFEVDNFSKNNTFKI